MSLLHKLLTTIQLHHAETPGKYESNLRAEDGFVPASKIRAGGLLRIYR